MKGVDIAALEAVAEAVTMELNRGSSLTDAKALMEIMKERYLAKTNQALPAEDTDKNPVECDEDEDDEEEPGVIGES